MKNPILITANYAQQVLNEFVRNGRPSSYLKFSEFFEDFIEGLKPEDINDKEPVGSFDPLMRIFGAAAFIRWKHVRDFDKDAVRIAERMINPINKLYASSGLREKLDRKPVDRGSCFYLTNFHPFAFNGVASCFGVYNLLDSFSEYIKNRKDLSISVFVSNPGLETEFFVRRHLSGNGNELSVTEFRGFNPVFQRLERDPPEYIFLDYFTYPYNLVPLLFPNSKVVYFGFGFSLFVFCGVSAIVTQEKTPLVGNFIADKATRFVDRFVCPPRKHDLTPNLLVRLPENSQYQASISRFRAIHRRVYSTLCRSGKISSEFISVVSQLLERDPDAGVVIAGAGCGSVVNRFSSLHMPRVLSLEQMPSIEILDITDIYLETFPEHQGLAVVEAMSVGVPVVFLDDVRYPHSLLVERSARGRATSFEGYIRLVELMAENCEERRGLLDEQRALLEKRKVGAKEYWDTVFGAACGRSDDAR